MYYSCCMRTTHYTLLMRVPMNKHFRTVQLPCRTNVNGVVNALVPPHELTPATVTLYSALGVKPSSLIMVSCEYTVMRPTPLL